LLAVLAVVSTACASRAAPAAAPAPQATGPTAQVVNATILANECQRFGRQNAQQAERTIDDLVEGCTAVPGGAARFAATLQPGGRIAITAAPGSPDVVPICVLKHSLIHKLALSKPCELDVRLEQTAVAIGAGDGGAR
jgi:hypothetical protein